MNKEEDKQPKGDPFPSYNLLTISRDLIERFEPPLVDLSFLFLHPAEARTDSLLD